jgi:hypothetical protein
MAGGVDIRVLEHVLAVGDKDHTVGRAPGVRLIVATERDGFYPRLAVFRKGRADDDREVLASALETFLALVLR